MTLDFLHLECLQLHLNQEPLKPVFYKETFKSESVKGAKGKIMGYFVEQNMPKLKIAEFIVKCSHSDRDKLFL